MGYVKIWALVIAHRSPMNRLYLSRLRRKSPCRGSVVSRQWVWRRVDLYLRLTFLTERHGCARTGRLTVLFVSKVFRNPQRLLLHKESEEAGDSAWRHSCMACGGDVCFINRVASTPETKATASESSSSLSLSHPSRLRLSLPRQAHHSPRADRPSFIVCSLSRRLSNFEPFSCCRTVASPFPAHHQLRARAVSLSPTNVLLLRGHVLSKTSTPFHEPPCTRFHTSLLQPDTSPASISHCLFHRRPIHRLTRLPTKRHSSNSNRIFTCPTARSARHLCRKWKPLVVICTLLANRGSAAVRSSVTRSLWQLLQ